MMTLGERVAFVLGAAGGTAAGAVLSDEVLRALEYVGGFVWPF